MNMSSTNHVRFGDKEGKGGTSISGASHVYSREFSSGILGSLRRPQEYAIAGISSSLIRKIKFA